MTANICRQCSADAEIKRLDRVEGEDSGIRIVIEGLPALNCANGHKRFLTPGFALEFIERTMTSDGILTAEPAVEKGLFRKRAHCPACGSQLPDEVADASRHQVEVRMPDFEPVTVELAVPVYRCPSCSQQPTLPKAGVERGVMQAMANAFRSADIAPG